MSEQPFELAICQACLGHGSKCETCGGKHYVTYKQAHKLWGQAFPGHLEGKKFVLDHGGEIPHIPNIKHSAAHEKLRADRAGVGVKRSVPEKGKPVDDGSGVSKDEKGNVSIHADVAGVKATAD